MLLATLIRSTDFPLTLLILAYALSPPVLSLLNTKLSPTLYPSPAVTIPTPLTVPGAVEVTVTV